MNGITWAREVNNVIVVAPYCCVYPTGCTSWHHHWQDRNIPFSPPPQAAGGELFCKCLFINFFLDFIAVKVGNLQHQACWSPGLLGFSLNARLLPSPPLKLNHYPHRPPSPHCRPGPWFPNYLELWKVSGPYVWPFVYSTHRMSPHFGWVFSPTVPAGFPVWIGTAFKTG